MRVRAVGEPHARERPLGFRAGAPWSAVFWNAPTITFSSTVMPPNGLSFWNVRPTPRRLISSGRSPAMATPSSRM